MKKKIVEMPTCISSGKQCPPDSCSLLVQCWFMKVLRKTLPASVSNLIKRPSVHIQILSITTLKAITRVSNKDLYLIARIIYLPGRYFFPFYHLHSCSLIQHQ